MNKYCDSEVVCKDFVTNIGWISWSCFLVYTQYKDVPMVFGTTLDVGL